MGEPANSEVERRAALVARQSFGRLVAMMASRNGDIAGAEDALGEGLRQALEFWPLQGVPRNPEAWLMTFARRRQVDQIRHRIVREKSVPELQLRAATFGDFEGNETIPDERLKLLFVCAHPAIEESVRTPLMLQTVLGFEAAEIAGLFVASAPAMAQRLVRAKRKIAEARIPFIVPQRSDMPARLTSVLEAIYGICAWQWNVTSQAVSPTRPLIDEAVYLAELVSRLVPGDPEALGLAALANYLAARRQPADEHYVPLDERTAAHWDLGRIRHAEALLRGAHLHGSIGRFQLEAAIQSVHAARAYSTETDWQALCLLHEALARLAPTTGGLIAQAIALCRAKDPVVGLAALSRLDPAVVETFQPYWAARASILADHGSGADAVAAFDKALSLTHDPSIREFLGARRALLSAPFD